MEYPSWKGAGHQGLQAQALQRPLLGYVTTVLKVTYGEHFRLKILQLQRVCGLYQTRLQGTSKDLSFTCCPLSPVRKLRPTECAGPTKYHAWGQHPASLNPTPMLCLLYPFLLLKAMHSAPFLTLIKHSRVNEKTQQSRVRYNRKSKAVLTNPTALRIFS